MLNPSLKGKKRVQLKKILISAQSLLDSLHPVLVFEAHLIIKGEFILSDELVDVTNLDESLEVEVEQIPYLPEVLTENESFPELVDWLWALK